MWKCPEWILSVLVHFDEGLDDFSTVFFLPTLLTPFDPFEPFLTISGLYKVFLDHFWDQNRIFLGRFWDDFGPFFLGGVDPGGHFEVTWGSFWVRFGVVLNPFWTIFETPPLFFAIFRPFLGLLCPFLGHFYGHFAVFWARALTAINAKRD